VSTDALCGKCGKEPRQGTHRWCGPCRRAWRKKTPAENARIRRARVAKKVRQAIPPVPPEAPPAPVDSVAPTTPHAPVDGDLALAAKVLRDRHRPYDPELAAAMLALIASGYSLRRASQHLHVSYSTMRSWVNDNVDNMAERYAAARAACVDYWADEIIDIADDGTNDTSVDSEGREVVNHDVIQRSKLRVESRRFVVSKLNSKVYGDKVQVEGGQTQNVFVIALSNPTRDPLARTIEAVPDQPDEAVLDFRGVLDRPRG